MPWIYLWIYLYVYIRCFFRLFRTIQRIDISFTVIFGTGSWTVVLYYCLIQFVCILFLLVEYICFSIYFFVFLVFFFCQHHNMNESHFCVQIFSSWTQFDQEGFFFHDLLIFLGSTIKILRLNEWLISNTISSQKFVRLFFFCNRTDEALAISLLNKMATPLVNGSLKWLNLKRK